MKKILRIPALVLIALVSACDGDDPTGPLPKDSVTINLCPEFMTSGVWIAVQNQGESWMQVTPSGSGVLTFDATEKVSIAFAYSVFGSSFTQVMNATANELDGTSGVPCEIASDFGDASLSGTVSGLTGQQFVRISAGPSTTSANATLASWTLGELPNVPLDLVATRFQTQFTSPANKVIVLRNVTPNASGVSLDFAGTSAHDFENATVTFNNAPTNGTLMLEMSFQANGTLHTLGTVSVFQPPFAFNYVSVPAALRVASDYHVLDAFASTADANLGIVHVYKAPSAKTLTFGPAVSAPTITQIATAPYLRLRAQLAKQPQYTSGAGILFFQNAGNEGVKLVDILTTSGFQDAGATSWDLAIPDFGAASGYDSDWGLSAGIEYFWDVIAFEADPSLLLGGSPSDGATATFSIRASGDNLATARAAGGVPRAKSRAWIPMRRGLVR